MFLTGSYDRTCIIWDTKTGDPLQKLTGHQNVVYSIGFNLPYSNKVGTGSFDHIAKIWNVSDGTCDTTFVGHEMEVVCLQFDPSSTQLLRGSMVIQQKYGILKHEKKYLKSDMKDKLLVVHLIQREIKY